MTHDIDAAVREEYWSVTLCTHVMHDGEPRWLVEIETPLRVTAGGPFETLQEALQWTHDQTGTVTSDGSAAS